MCAAKTALKNEMKGSTSWKSYYPKGVMNGELFTNCKQRMMWMRGKKWLTFGKWMRMSVGEWVDDVLILQNFETAEKNFNKEVPWEGRWKKALTRKSWDWIGCDDAKVERFILLVTWALFPWQGGTNHACIGNEGVTPSNGCNLSSSLLQPWGLFFTFVTVGEVQSHRGPNVSVRTRDISSSWAVHFPPSEFDSDGFTPCGF